MTMLSPGGTPAVQCTSDPPDAGLEVAEGVGVGKVPLLGELEVPAVPLADAVEPALGVTWAAVEELPHPVMTMTTTRRARLISDATLACRDWRR
jgi:hypothetical protein